MSLKWPVQGMSSEETSNAIYFVTPLASELRDHKHTDWAIKLQPNILQCEHNVVGRKGLRSATSALLTPQSFRTYCDTPATTARPLAKTRGYV